MNHRATQVTAMKAPEREGRGRKVKRGKMKRTVGREGKMKREVGREMGSAVERESEREVERESEREVKRGAERGVESTRFAILK